MKKTKVNMTLEKSKEKNKGITLIALVITIVVILIVAVVTIVTLIGENGIITRTQETKEQTEISTEKEKIELALMEYKIDSNDKTLQEILDANYNTWIFNDVVIVISKKKGYVFEINNDIVTYKGINIAPNEESRLMYRDDEKAFWQEEYRNKITKIEFKNYIVIPENIVEKWDVSFGNDNSVIAWIVNNDNEGYNLYIGGSGRIEIVYGSRYFENFQNLKEIYINNLDISKGTNINYLFQGCTNLRSIDLSGLEFSNIINMIGMFQNCSNLESIKFGNINTRKVVNMAYMFYGCSSLKSIDIENISTENVSNMTAMFYNCKNLKSLNLMNFNTEKVNVMNSMFDSCENLEEINLQSFNTINVTSMKHLFKNCISLEKINLSNFNTTKVTDMSYMFFGCSNLKEIQVNSFETENVNNMRNMFENCKKLKKLDLSNFKTNNIEDIQYFIGSCVSLEELNISKIIINDTVKYNGIFNEIPTSTKIITNFEMSNWIRENFPTYTNITIVE